MDLCIHGRKLEDCGSCLVGSPLWREIEAAIRRVKAPLKETVAKYGERFPKAFPKEGK